jgi:aminopeptidase N
VQHYDLRLRYDPATDILDGDVTITALATQRLTGFDLDFSGLTVRSITVDGRPVGFMRDGAELKVALGVAVVNGAPFVVEVVYAGVPIPAGVDEASINGWHVTEDGAYAMGEPDGPATWFPVNDHPRDKATYAIEITVPDGLAAVSNGVQRAKSTAEGWTTWRWEEAEPMASYLVVVAIGRYRVAESTHDGLPMVIAVDSDLPARVDAELARTGEIVDFLSGLFGPYPFDAMGAIAYDGRGWAMETQTRPMLPGGGYAPVMAHELAHQWFGDSVSVYEWRDLWLNEGFATYAEWLWNEHEGGKSVQQAFDEAYDTWSLNPDIPRSPAVEPGPKLFTFAAYTRGAMVLQALRIAVSDGDFFTILRTWALEHAYGNASTDDFVDLAERIAGAKVRPAIYPWLYDEGRPPRPLYAGELAAGVAWMPASPMRTPPDGAGHRPAARGAGPTKSGSGSPQYHSARRQDGPAYAGGSSRPPWMLCHSAGHRVARPASKARTSAAHSSGRSLSQGARTKIWYSSGSSSHTSSSLVPAPWTLTPSIPGGSARPVRMSRPARCSAVSQPWSAPTRATSAS